jgi:hypothetical protein
MAIDFLTAVIGEGETKARSYLVAGDRRTISELRQSAQISVRSANWIVQQCAFSGDTGYLDALLTVPSGQQAVRVRLIRTGDEWRVEDIEPAPAS